MPERQKTTIRDVANRAGVSISSVSRAMSGHPHVSDELRSRVESAARELGFRPHFIGHSLRTGATKTIGFLVGNIVNPVIGEMFEATTEVLSSRGYATTLVFSRNDPQQDAFYLRFMADRQVDGLLVSSATNGPDQTGPILADLGIPTVVLDRDLPAGAHISAIQSDHVSGMRTAVSHLCQLDHRRIAYIGGVEYTRVFRERLRGFRLGMSDACAPIDPDLIYSVPLYGEEGERAALDLMVTKSPPTALIVAANVLLAGVLRALRSLHVSIGQDLALIGADDIETARLSTPPMSVVGRDMGLFGRSAANAVLDLVQGGTGQRVIDLPTWLIVRESSTCRPVSTSRPNGYPSDGTRIGL